VLYIKENETIRDEIKMIVASIIPFDSVEKEHINFVKDWLESDAEIFRIAKPDKPHIHLVSYFMVVDPDSNEFLLVDHKKAQLWLPPGGHVEPNEHPREAVIREAKEELGIESEFLLKDPLFLTVINTVGNEASHTDVSLWYVVRADRHNFSGFDSEEFHQIRWFRRNEIPFERTDPHMKRFIDKMAEKIATLNSYDVSASDYAKNTENFHPEEDAQKFIYSLPPHAKIIDIGCGPGRDAKVFSDYGLDVVGIDFSPNMIEIAKQSVPNGSFYIMDMEAIAFPSETFDGVWANCALLHVPKKNISLVFQNIHLILKPKGSFYLSVKQSDRGEIFEGDSRYGGLEKYWSFYEPNELVQLLIEANFRIVDVMITKKPKDYHTHAMIKIIAEKL
jgi:8-oxo-dGTP diphosphatase